MENKNVIQINMKAYKIKRRLTLALGWSLFIASVVGFILAATLFSMWYVWVISGVLVFFAITVAADIEILKLILASVEEGTFSIQEMKKNSNYTKNIIRDHARAMIKAGIFPDAVIRDDIIVSKEAGILLDAVIKDNITTPNTTTQTQKTSIESVVVNEPIQPAQKVDINTATEQELSNLPGVGIALAKRAVQLRKDVGDFASVKDFCKKLELKPHFAVQIENLAFTQSQQSQSQNPQRPKKNTSRVVDI